jgi:hypothetical protein
MIKQLMARAGAASFALMSPVQARVERETGDLLRLVSSYGVEVNDNSNECGGAMGRFTLRPSLSIHICYDSKEPTANDHDTARHEVWHYLQWCKNPTHIGLLPLHKDRDAYIRFVQNALSDNAIERIDSNYPVHIRAVEYEAFAAANALTATQLMSMVREHCTPM